MLNIFPNGCHFYKKKQQQNQLFNDMETKVRTITCERYKCTVSGQQRHRYKLFGSVL